MRGGLNRDGIHDGDNSDDLFIHNKQVLEVSLVGR